VQQKLNKQELLPMMEMVNGEDAGKGCEENVLVVYAIEKIE